jgi:membrane peptidoglycan carboxypeptidase
MLTEIEGFTENANSVKELVLSKLYTDGIITMEQYNEYCDLYQVIVIKSSWFKKWKSIFKPNEKKDEGVYQFKYVKFEQDFPKEKETTKEA